MAEEIKIIDFAVCLIDLILKEKNWSIEDYHKLQAKIKNAKPKLDDEKSLTSWKILLCSKVDDLIYNKLCEIFQSQLDEINNRLCKIRQSQLDEIENKIGA